jgi:hypothetical protein
MSINEEIVLEFGENINLEEHIAHDLLKEFNIPFRLFGPFIRDNYFGNDPILVCGIMEYEGLREIRKFIFNRLTNEDDKKRFQEYVAQLDYNEEIRCKEEEFKN